MKKIALHGRHGTGKFVIVDDCNFEYFSTLSWTLSSEGYVLGRINNKEIIMHRYIMGNPASDIDHRNRNKLDNRRVNLRTCTSSQNISNTIRTKSVHPEIKYRGIYETKYHKWHAAIIVNGKKLHLGSFGTQVLAARAYDQAAIKYQGEFAILNFSGLVFP